MLITDEELTKKYANDIDKLLDCEQLLEVFPPSRNTRNYQLCLSLTLKEISNQIQKLKNDKSPGKDKIVAESLKNGGKKPTHKYRK